MKHFRELCVRLLGLFNLRINLWTLLILWNISCSNDSEYKKTNDDIQQSLLTAHNIRNIQTFAFTASDTIISKETEFYDSARPKRTMENFKKGINNGAHNYQRIIKTYYPNGTLKSEYDSIEESVEFSRGTVSINSNVFFITHQASLKHYDNKKRVATNSISLYGYYEDNASEPIERVYRNTIYTYSKGQKTKVTNQTEGLRYFGDQDPFPNNETYYYNEIGFLTKNLKFDGSEKLYEIIYDYNEFDSLESISAFNTKINKTDEKKLFVYNDQKELIEEILYSPKPYFDFGINKSIEHEIKLEVSSRTTYKWSNNKVIEEKRITYQNEKPGYGYVILNTYKNNILSQKVSIEQKFDIDGSVKELTKHIKENDLQGREVLSQLYRDGKEEYNYQNVYENDRLISEKNNNKGVSSELTIKYKDGADFQEKTVYENDQIVSIKKVTYNKLGSILNEKFTDYKNIERSYEEIFEYTETGLIKAWRELKDGQITMGSYYKYRFE